MRVVTKTVFSDMKGVELAAVDEVLQITSSGTAIGYFVPPEIWLDTEREAMQWRQEIEKECKH